MDEFEIEPAPIGADEIGPVRSFEYRCWHLHILPRREDQPQKYRTKALPITRTDQ
jgi:hypothetical protein